MLTKEEYKKEFMRMMDSLRDRGKGRPNCDFVQCDICPLNGKVCNNVSEGKLFLAFEAIEIVENWSKEHPKVTRADKFKEVFGVEPKNVIDRYECPFDCGFKENECARAFWEAEYVEPKNSEVE